MANWAQARLSRDAGAPFFGGVETSLNGAPAPPPSAAVCGFSVIAAGSGPQVAVMEPARMFAASVRGGEEVRLAIPARNLVGGVRFSATVALIQGRPAEVELLLGEHRAVRRVEQRQEVELALQCPESVAQTTLVLTTRGTEGEAGVRWGRLRCLGKDRSFDIPLTFSRAPGRFPPALFPEPRLAIAQELLEWDWRMQEGIGTPREARALATSARAATLYGLVDTGELFRSVDGGATWAVHSVLPVRDAVALAARTSAPALHLASRSGSVFRSQDAGSSWVAVGALPLSDVVDMAIRSDGALLVLTGSGTVLESTDQGATFTGLGALPTGGLVSLASTTGPVRIYAATRTGEVFESTNGGGVWALKGTMPVSDVVRLRATPSSLFLLTGAGDVYRSTDTGASWTAVGTLSQVGMCGLVRDGTQWLVASREGHVAGSGDGTAWSWLGSMNQLGQTALASGEPALTGVGAPASPESDPRTVCPPGGTPSGGSRFVN